MTTLVQNASASTHAVGAALDRIDGRLKVTGAATYAYEYPIAGVTSIALVQSTIARGRIVSFDASAAQALPGVLAVLWHENAPRLAPQDDQDLAVFQSDEVAYRGQIVAAVVAETLETAREAARLVRVGYEVQLHDVELRADRGDLYKPDFVPEKAAAFYAADSVQGDVEAALAAAPVSVDLTYTTPAEHHNPLEPHAALAVWSGDDLTVYDTSRGSTSDSGPSPGRFSSRPSTYASSHPTSVADLDRRGLRTRTRLWRSWPHGLSAGRRSSR